MKSRGRAVSVFSLIAVVMIVGLALRSRSPSRTVGHGAIEEACFDLGRAVRTPNQAAAHPLFERAQDAASRSQDLALVNDVSRVSKMYAGKDNVVPLTNQLVQDAVSECEKQGWNATDPCLFGAAVCGPIAGRTTPTS
jgi:hypothetical protein